MRLFTRSKREALVYIVLSVWIIFGLIAFKTKTNFTELSVYFGVFATNVMMYIWGETTRPHDEKG